MDGYSQLAAVRSGGGEGGSVSTLIAHSVNNPAEVLSSSFLPPARQRMLLCDHHTTPLTGQKHSDLSVKGSAALTSTLGQVN